ncbi:GCN5-related N-acetyltransferase [Evansella cellulosilytica DSM 2522]|uniref:GCN5-related N-acetyltransferase n=1 Tax=Evansella cellulosilytica (strain ATCC 21833 / DSM 2522 / FERM P-1141 / JCM 9156 / N-4) TaxID=649639 RepID=E6TT24_EVAC2|nr:GCN5-related N-acetyltransferase [Evansella cellulosilytica DSM 2522]
MLMEKVYEIAAQKKIELDYWCKNSVAKHFYAKQAIT